MEQYVIDRFCQRRDNLPPADNQQEMNSSQFSMSENPKERIEELEERLADIERTDSGNLKERQRIEDLLADYNEDDDDDIDSNGW